MRTERKRKQQEAISTQHIKQIYILKYIEHILSKPMTTSMKEKGIDKYANAQTIMCAECTSNNVGAHRILEKNVC